jgi:hypothetical protein
VIEHPRDAELVLGLFEKLLVLFAMNGHHLEGVVAAIGTAMDVQDGTVRPGTQCAEDLKPSYGKNTHGSRFRLSKTIGERPTDTGWYGRATNRLTLAVRQTWYGIMREGEAEE